jgi:hypothetical protein
LFQRFERYYKFAALVGTNPNPITAMKNTNQLRHTKMFVAISY